MYGESINQSWDFFLAHAGPDTSVSVALYEALRPHASVFLDERSMLPGDPWAQILPAVLKHSRIIVVLVSRHTRKAWYQDSEIRIALDLLRDFPERYRVIPLLLDESAPVHRPELPYGLEQTVPLSWARSGGLPQVTQRLLEVLRADKVGIDGDRAPAADRPAMPTDSATAFLGQTTRGPTWPLAVTNWEDFVGLFGVPLDARYTYLPHAVRGFFENGGELAYVTRVVAANATRAALQVATEDPGQHLVFTALSPGAHGSTILVRVQRGSRTGVRLTIEASCGAEAEARAGHQSDEPGLAAEDFDNLSLSTSGPNPLLDVVNRRSELVSVAWAEPEASGAMPAAGAWRLRGGTDSNPTVDDYLGNPGGSRQDRTGLASLVPLDDVATVCIPDATHPQFAPGEQEALTKSLVAHCERHKRFAILSARPLQSEDEVITAPADSSAAAIYVPWIRVPDLSSGRGSIDVPPVGHIAGSYARHDRESGVHVSPIRIALKGLAADNTNRGLCCDIGAQRADAFVRRGVNVLGLEMEPPTRVCLQSAVTMAIEDSWRPVGVRRFFNFVERSIAAGTAWVTLAPNDEATWAQVREELERFLTRLWRAGVLRGSSPEEAFFVRCDRSTMTEADIAMGRVNWVIGVALADQELKFPAVAGTTGRGAGSP